MKHFWFCLLGLSVLLGFSAKAQITEDFTDGDFTSNPAWIGMTDSFTVSAGQLRTTAGNGSSVNLYLGTASTQNFTSWEFFFRLAFNPSTQNYAEFWLTTDNLNTSLAQNGYFVRLGKAEDAVGLFKMEGGVETELIPQSGNALLAGTNNLGSIRVTRSTSGNWEMFEKVISTNFTSIGTANDNAITSSQGIGIFIKSSKTNRTRHYFDDIKTEIVSGPDVTPPNLTNASAAAADQVDLNFSESVDPDFSNQISLYSLNPSITIVSAERLASNFSTIRLTLASGMTPAQAYTVSVVQSKDLAGNIQATAQQANFTYSPIVPVGFRSVVINEIMAAPSGNAGTNAPQAEFIELYNPGNQAVVMNGWTIRDASTATPKTIADFTLPANGYVVMTSASNQALFTGLTPMIFMTLPSLNNDKDSLVLSDALGNPIDIVAYKDTWYQDLVKKTGGYSLEQINPKLVCSGASNWIGANFPEGGSPTTQNPSFSSAPDLTPPTLVKSELNGLNQIRLTFSEFLKDEFFLNSWVSLPGFTISQVQNRFPSPEKITITLTSDMEVGVKYLLTVTHIKDCAGNLMPDTTFAVGKGKTPARFDLLITEVQSDDSPENTLPASEYVEIYNNTDKLLDLTGVQLTDGSNVARFSTGVLGKGEYLVICYLANVSKFAGVQTAGILPYQMLNQEGDNLTLKGGNDGWLHQFHFRSSDYSPYSQWLKGWSVEMIDPTNPCDELGNWTISTSAVGGTPGNENSVKASKSDGNAPVLIKATLVDSNRVKLKWNELVDSSFLASTGITLSADRQVVSRSVTSADFSSIQVKFTPNLLPGQVLTITVGPVVDCAGNQSNTTTVQAAQPEKADSTDWVLNEILFDPLSGGVDYVELYNGSNKYLDLQELYLANDEDGAALVFEPTVVNPGGFALLTPDKTLTLRDYPKGKAENFIEMTSFPSFNSDSGTVRIVAYGKTWQKFFYSAKYHTEILDVTKGVSLERISGDLPVNESSSWQSASSDAGFGTPGYVNSQNQDLNQGTNFSVDPKAFSPDGDGNKDFTLFTYSEASNGRVANLRIYSADGFLIKNLAQSANLGTGGFWKWDGLNDDGNKARIGLYLAVLETYELGGSTKYYRIPVAIAADK